MDPKRLSATNFRRFLLLAVIAGAGCGGGDPSPRPRANLVEKVAATAPSAGATGKPSVAEPPSDPFAGAKRTEFGKNVWMDTKGDKRRVVVAASVCLREGSYGLECLLCRKFTKEHESILASDADAAVIHATLLLTGAEPGSPVRYEEKGDKIVTIAPKGTKINVLLQYEENGKTTTVPAQKWIRSNQTQKNLDSDWVFAGSHFYANPDDPKGKPYYAANSDGSFINILNMTTAMIDLPLVNPNRDPALREYQPHTERIPPLETKVFVLLEPVIEKKAAKN